MRHVIWPIALFTIVWLMASPSKPIYAQSPLQVQYQQFGNDPSLKHAGWSFYVYDLDENIPVLRHNHQRSLIPASVQKLVTTITALKILGSDYRYKTAIQHDGHIDSDGTLRGNVYITGSGDPSLGSSYMHDSLSLNKLTDKFIKAVKFSGINSIQGHVIADESVFDQEMIPRKWLWEDIGNYFGAGSSGLTVNENAFTIYFNAGQTIGAPAHVSRTDPAMPHLTFINHVKTGLSNSGDQVYIFGAPYVQERLLTGTVPSNSRNFPVKGSMPDPPLFLAQTLYSQLQENKIAISGKALSMRLARMDNLVIPLERKEIGHWLSPDIAALVNRTNMESVNVYAENLVRTIGLVGSGEGSLKAGIAVINEFWKDSGVDISGMTLHDGSGLSPANRITTELLVTMLTYASNDDISIPFINSLPVAGRSGNLARLFINSHSEGILQAKSGFLSNVRAYSGYSTLKNGNRVAFALIVNDYQGSHAAMRNKMIRLLDTIRLH